MQSYMAGECSRSFSVFYDTAKRDAMPDETLRREEAYRYHKAPVYAFGFVCSGTMAVWKIGMDRQYMVIKIEFHS